MTAPDPYDELDPTKVRDEHPIEQRDPVDDRFAEPVGYVGRDSFPAYQPKQRAEPSPHPAPSTPPLIGHPHSARRYTVLLLMLLAVFAVTQGISLLVAREWAPILAVGMGVPAVIGLVVVIVQHLREGRR